MKKIIIFILFIAAFGILIFAAKKDNGSVPPAPIIGVKSRAPELRTLKTNSPFSAPLTKSKERITKKPMGIYITPNSSPVSPERFTGFHTGTDFEVSVDELDMDEPVYAICTGEILQKQFGRGYGGMIVQSCTFDGAPITVVYGHVRISSASVDVGDNISSGSFLANLGTGGSEETDGERKHLHLGIHKGANVDTRGYVANRSELSNWIDIEEFL